MRIKIRGSVVSLSLTFPHPLEDDQKNKKGLRSSYFTLEWSNLARAAVQTKSRGLEEGYGIIISRGDVMMML